MGGCCCCESKSNEDIGTSPFFQYPPPEEYRPSPNHATSSVPGGFLVDTNLDTSIPDTYRPPPTPPPYEMFELPTPMSSGNQQGSKGKCEMTLRPSNSEPIEDTNAGSTLKTKVKKFESDEKGELDVVLEASIEREADNLDELKKFVKPFVPPLLDEDDSCPICLEEYDAENPKLITKCDHHFHLACILEWMERSDTCPVCDQETILVPVEG